MTRSSNPKAAFADQCRRPGVITPLRFSSRPPALPVVLLFVIFHSEVIAMATCSVVKRFLHVEDVIGQVVALKRRGSIYVGRCPFHDDHHPSLVVWPRTQTWKCMTCSSVRDDVIGFVARWHHCSTREALLYLNEALPDRPADVPKPDGPTRATLSDRDATYRRLIAAWSLSPAHRAQLRRRGLSLAMIRQARFASLAPGLSPVIPTSAGVPGFFVQHKRWQVSGPAGLAIPVTNAAGQIQAIHIRADAAQRGKYRWLSTPEFRQGGASSGSPVHVVRGVNDVIWVTEGPLKAIVAQERLQHTVLGVPGVTAWQSVPDIVADLGPKRVLIAFDRDVSPQTAAAVAEQIERLRDAIATQVRVPVLTATWDGPKGLDDALVAKVPIRWH